MKKTIIVLLFIFGLFNSNSQSYIPMVEDSMIVVNQYLSVGNPYTVIYKYIGDTTINSKSYFKVFKCTNMEDSSFVINSNLSYYGAIREVNKKVYFLIKDSTIERKIYDFSLSLNDTTSIFYTSSYLNKNVIVTLDDVDSTSWKYLFYGRKVYVHSHNSTSFFNHYHIIQGFGVTEFSSNEIEWDYPTKKICSIKKNNPSHNIPISYSACYWQIKNSFISLSEIESNSVEVYPNPAINQITIQSNDTDLQSVSIYDVNGKFINQISVQKNKEVIDLKFMKSGIYTLKIVTEKGIITKKIVKR